MGANDTCMMGAKQVTLPISCVTHCVLFDYFQAIHTQGFTPTSPFSTLCGLEWLKKVHKLNSIVPLAYAHFTILIILLLPHHHQCIASVYSISICRGGPFSTAEYGICWTPSLAPCSSMNKLLCSPHSSTTLLHLWGLLSTAIYGILLNSTSLARLLLHSPAIVLSTLQP